MYEQIDFRFRYQVSVNSIHGTLFKYLRSKDTEFPREQMILWSLSAFWYVNACRWQGKFSEAELKQKARNAIYQLQQQINYLTQIFGLDPQEFALKVAAYESNGSSNKVSAPIELPKEAMFPQGLTPVASVVETDSGSYGPRDINAEVPTLASPSLMPRADDDVLDEAFNN